MSKISYNIMIRRFRQINENLYRGSAPNELDVQALFDLGIRKIISLDEKTGKKIDPICNKLGIIHLIIPLNVRDKSSLNNLVANNLYSTLMDNGPTFIHCLHGKDRTGLVIAMFRVRYQNWEPKEAIKEAKQLGFGLFVAPEMVKLYEDLIKAAKTSDVNDNQDIVGNAREEQANGFRDNKNQTSFVPPLDPSVLYTGAQPGRAENPETGNYSDSDNSGEVMPDFDSVKNSIPEVGQYNTESALAGANVLSNGIGSEWV